MVVGGSEVVFDVFPDVVKIGEVEVQVELVFPGEQFVLDSVGVVAEDGFLVGRVYVQDEGEVECFFAGLEQCLVIRFKIHRPPNYYNCTRHSLSHSIPHYNLSSFPPTR